MSSEQTVISVENLKFSYEKNQLSSFSNNLDIPILKIKKGQSVFMYGPSGSGKTTLLSILTLILRPQSGSISILGQNLSDLDESQRDAFRGNNMGYIFQMLNLIPYLSTLENILLPLRLNPKRGERLISHQRDKHDKHDKHEYLRLESQKILKEEAMRLAGHLKIESLIERPVSQLSVGQQQRVAVARALIGNPGLIIADEPTSALDFDTRDLFLDLLLDQAQKSSSTVLFVSHDQSLMNHFESTIDIREINRGFKNDH